MHLDVTAKFLVTANNSITATITLVFFSPVAAIVGLEILIVSAIEAATLPLPLLKMLLILKWKNQCCPNVSQQFTKVLVKISQEWATGFS